MISSPLLFPKFCLLISMVFFSFVRSSTRFEYGSWCMWTGDCVYWSWNKIYLGQLLRFFLFQFEIIAVDMGFSSILLCHFDESLRSEDSTEATIRASNSMVHWTTAASIKTHSLGCVSRNSDTFREFQYLPQFYGFACENEPKGRGKMEEKRTTKQPTFNKLIFISLFVYIVIW